MRVETGNGLAFLRIGRSAPIACKLLNLGEGGCRIQLSLDEAELWDRRYKPGAPIELRLSVPPHLNDFSVIAQYRNNRFARDAEHIELGLNFRSMPLEAAERLRQALIKVTTQLYRDGRTHIVPTAPGHTAAKNTPPPKPKPKPKTQAWGATKPAMLPLDKTSYRGRRLGEVLAQMGKLTAKQIEAAAEESRSRHERFGQCLLRKGLISEAELYRALSLASGLPVTDLRETVFSGELRKLFPLSILRRNGFVPIDSSPKVACIAAAVPPSPALLLELGRICGRKLEVFLAFEDQITRLLKGLPVSEPKNRSFRARRYPRYKFAATVKYFFCLPSGERLEAITYTGQALDLSEGGFKIQGPRPAFGDFTGLGAYGIYVQLTVSHDSHEFNALCRPVYVREKDTVREIEYPWEMGLMILDIAEKNARQLNKMIEAAKASGHAAMV